MSVTPWLEAPRLPSPDDQTAADRRAVTEALVVWDATADRARAERDSWVITYGEPHRRNVLADYATLTGRSVTTDDLLVQASRWDLTEVALYAARFSRPHADEARSRRLVSRSRCRRSGPRESAA